MRRNLSREMPRGSLPRLQLWQRGKFRLGLSRAGVAVLRTETARGAATRSGAGLFGARRAGADASAGAHARTSSSVPPNPALLVAGKPAPAFIERAWPDMSLRATPDELAAQIGDALDEAGGGALPVHVTFGDDLVRYFIVTPPPNGTRFQDLRTAAEVRFQMLYGESAAAWQLVADWQAAAPFLACAVPQRLHTALHLAARARRNCLVSTVPNFVGAWNRWRRRVGGAAWLATLHDGALTLGVVEGPARRSRLAAVRTLMLPEQAPPLAWLHEQLARTALLDNVPAPKVLHVHGPCPEIWQQQAPDAASAGSAARDASGAANHGEIAVRACIDGRAVRAASSDARLSPAAQLAWDSLAR
ncbi:hypothetical protein LMG29739_05986 [Paraburkholderia solisilvae]|uniref:Uncharacterized protein n=1 Tax=Paraburkholderia solisilvae TaxID=624376 RepID=A0A6J5F1W1_9BURK|nr:hypothetical protein LMG29739_05986 [Paraburkholderia solisilvae]